MAYLCSSSPLTGKLSNHYGWTSARENIQQCMCRRVIGKVYTHTSAHRRTGLRRRHTLKRTRTHARTFALHTRAHAKACPPASQPGPPARTHDARAHACAPDPPPAARAERAAARARTNKRTNESTHTWQHAYARPSTLTHAQA